jgi:hypothetical protein
MRGAVSLVLILVAVGLGPGGAVAAELAKSGAIAMRYYSHNVQTIAELDTADGMKSYVNEAFVFHVSREKGGLLDNTSERCVGYGTYHPEKGAVHEVGHCTSVDADGDKVFGEYEVKLKDANDKTPGAGHFLGGTGKYQGIKGSYTLTVEMLQPMGPGHTMWAGDIQGQYNLGE